MQDRDHALLREGLQVDEEVPAANQVESVEGWILEDVVLRKNHPLAHGAADLEILPLGCEVFLEQVRRDFCHGVCGVDSLPGDLERVAVEVGGEDFVGQAFLAMLGDRLIHQHGDRVGLLAGGAGRHPHAERAALQLLHHPRQHGLAQSRECLGIAEKRGHADEHVLGEILTLGRIVLKVGDIILEHGLVAEAHAALDAAVHAFLFVVGDVEARVAFQEALERVHSLAGFLIMGDWRGWRFGLCPSGESHDLARESFGIGHQVGGAGEDHALGHSGELRGFGGLHEDEPAGLVQGTRAVRPVAAGAGEDHGDGFISILPREGLQQSIDSGRRRAMAVLAFASKAVHFEFK